LTISNEGSVVAELVEEQGRRKALNSGEDLFEDDDFTEFDLTDFTIYLPGTNVQHPYELISLHALATRFHPKFLFDGFLSFGDVRRYVERIPFEICSIGNYGVEDLDSIETEVWIKSDLNIKSDIFYRLRSPALEYVRFFEAFLWTARLSNLFVEFARNRPYLSVHSFRSDFYQWADQKHGHSKAFQAWHSKYGSDDFRGHVSTNIEFLYNEAVGLDWTLHKLAIWRELRDAKAIPFQKIKTSETFVTPYVYDLWNHLPFGHHLKAVTPVAGKGAYIRCQDTEKLIEQDHPAKVFFPSREHDIMRNRPDIANIRIGDVLAVTKDLHLELS